MIRVDPNNPKGIIWIASYPKSGNTWVRIFLYHLQRIMAGHPLPAHDLHELDRSSVYEAGLAGLFEQLMGRKLTEATWQEVVPVRPMVHETIADRAPSVVLIKTHNLLGRMQSVPTINLAVSAGSIYLVRNPLDVVISLADHLGLSVDDAIRVMADPGHRTKNQEGQAFEIWGSWSEHFESWLGKPSSAVISVRYEDLLEDPIKHFTAIANHLGQKPEPEQIAEAVELASFKRLSDQEAKRGFDEVSEFSDRFFRVGQAGQWRQKLSAEQVEHITAKHRPWMERFGYLPD